MQIKHLANLLMACGDVWSKIYWTAGQAVATTTTYAGLRQLGRGRCKRLLELFHKVNSQNL
jgi:hypothetical protein